MSHVVKNGTKIQGVVADTNTPNLGAIELTSTVVRVGSVFEQFRELVYQKSGISLGPKKISLVTARIGKRMRALAITDYEEYLRRVTNDASERELVYLLDAISTNVTSFFREAPHFSFVEKVLTEWKNQGHTRFRFWSAASSTGEEPYTLAMVANEVLGARG